VLHILNIGQLDEIYYRVTINRDVLHIFDPTDRLQAKVNRATSRLYYLEFNVEKPMCLAARSTDEAWWWHSCFGHLNCGSLRKLVAQNMVHELPLLDQLDQVCDGCLVGKQRCTPFPAQVRRRVDPFLDLVHSDLCSSVTPGTSSGKRYFLLLVDDLS
jgi:hypothetical protein